MSTQETIELESADGKRTWSTNDPGEITNLRARGWRVKPVSEDATFTPAFDGQPAPYDQGGDLAPALAEITPPAGPAAKAAPAKSNK